MAGCGAPALMPAEETATVVVVPADLPSPTSTTVVTPTATPTPTPTATITPTFTPSPSPPASPTASATPTATPSPSPTPDPLWTLSDPQGARETVTTTVEGLAVTVHLATGSSLSAREWFAVDRVTLNTASYPDAAPRLGEAVMRAHWHAWQAQNPEQRETFEEFTAALTRGDDRSYSVIVTQSGAEGAPGLQEGRADPRQPVELFYTDEPGPIYLAEGASFHLALTPEGTLRLGVQVPPPVPRYYDRHQAEDPAGAQAYYTSYVFSPAAALHILSLSPAFQSHGVRAPEGAGDAARLTLCREFRDLDELLLPCEEAGGYEAVVRAVVTLE
jgi:hypothetical protein